MSGLSVYDHVFNTLVGCFVINILRAMGMFGFFGGIANWIAVEMLFVKIPLIYGRYGIVCCVVCSVLISSNSLTLVV